MSESFLTVETAAERLKLHPKTVLRFIREGRLRATKVGRQYRILQSDLASLVGGPEFGPTNRTARATVVVDVPASDAELARRMAALVTSVERPEAGRGEPLSVDVVHDPQRQHLKVFIIGDPGDTAQVLRLIQILLEN